MSELPNDGDIIEFSEVPAGSLCRAKVKYRVERKPLDREFLLVDTASGHASRVPAHEFRRAKWAEAKPVELSPAGYPLANQPTEGDALTGNLAIGQYGPGGE